MKKNISRRKFVKTTLATTAAVTIAPKLSIAMGKNPFDAKGLPTKVLGNTGVKVPILGYGLGSRWMSIKDDDKALEILEYAHDNGLYYWDTAAIYGNDNISSEERIGKLLPSKRKEVFLVTKVEERDADKAKAQIERSLKRLNTDYIDLLHVHSIKDVKDSESLGEDGKVYKVMKEFHDQGVVKHIGFTGHMSADGMKRAAELYDFEVMMIALNHHQDNEQAFEEQAVPFAKKKGLGVVAMKVVRPRETVEGISVEKLVRYSLTIDEFSLANIGMDSMEVLKKNLEIIKKFKPLDKKEMKEVQAALQPFYRSQNLAWMDPHYVDGQFDGFNPVQMA